MSTKHTDHLGEKIKRLREERGMPLSKLARRSGVSRGYLHLIEKGESSPTEEKLAAIAAALGVLISDLVGELKDDPFSDIPDSLKEFAKARNLPSSDVAMLNRISYRGKRPTTVAEWQVLYAVIKDMLDKD
jgi:transcriptional regulator with XRE-family HTH domain